MRQANKLARARKTMIRLFTTDDLQAGQSLELQRPQAHYLRNVMRQNSGDEILLFNGRNGEWRSTLSLSGKRDLMAMPTTRTRPQSSSSGPWLVFAALKRGPTELIIEKATELGVGRLFPVTTAHSIADRLNIDRLQAHAVEAAEQCERLDVPSIAPLTPLSELIDTWPPERRLLIAAERRNVPPLATFLHLPPPRLADGLLIGPEGGYSDWELDGLLQLPFCFPISLGPRILRAETAAITALGCWQNLVGDVRTEA